MGTICIMLYISKCIKHFSQKLYGLSTQNFDNVNNITKSQFMKEAMNISEFVAKLENLCVK